MNDQRRRRASGPVVPHASTPAQRVLAWGIANAVRCLWRLQRVQLADPHGLIPRIRSGPVIFAAWHNRLALSIPVYRFLVDLPPARRNMAALVSASRDGALLAAILEAMEVQPVRGSSSRRGPQALLELTSWADQGLDLAITPDGPRGPRYQVQPGVVSLARITGLPIIPVACNAPRKLTLKSWDRFQVPLPLGRYQIALGPALVVPSSGDDSTLEDQRLALEQSLLALTRD